MDMSNTVLSQTDSDECKFVEVLTTEISGEVIGYRFAGVQHGPSVLVAGHADLMAALFERINNLPTMPFSCGNLYMVTLDGIECSDMTDIKRCLPEAIFDEVVMLPYASAPDLREFSVDRGYWAIVRLCQTLGMK
ncbi:MAG: hypothetical protein WBG95_05270 [Sulfitobacter sp.]